jgi:hypothetical protein
VKPLAILLAVALSGGCALGRSGASGAVAAPQPAVVPDRPSISEASLRAHMEFLAGDALNGRGSGSRDEWIAVSYAAAQMRRLGLEPLGDTEGFVQFIARGADRTWNAVGRLPGQDGMGRDEVILLSAHIDHLGNRSDRPNAPRDAVYNGADDDASGTIAVLELMEALARGAKLRRSIVFALFGSEERGGLGSLHFAEAPTVPLAQIVANLQFELIGRPDAAVPPRTLWLTGFERSDLGPELAEHGARLVRDPHPEMNFFTRSDNIQFARRGVVAHTVSSYGLHKQYHTPADEIHLIDFAHMADAIGALVEPIRWLADSGFTPRWHPGMQPAARE